ncbi:MAG: hypothetical protein QUS09_10915 [Methanotrichaceae archaeon]|nr:hypothetical protein [Methanotrichaceae archaeon]
MEFESKITGFATGLLLLGSYIMLFDMWNYSSFLVALSSILLLLVAFRDHNFGRSDMVGLVLAALVLLFFFIDLANNTFLPLVVVLALSLAAINARPEAFVPSLAGLLVLQFLNTAFLIKWLNIVFVNLSPLLKVRYDINDLGYLVLYHSKTHLPILIDDVKLLIPFYVSLLVAGLVLLAILKDDRKTLMRYALLIVAVPFLFILLTLQNLLYGPETAIFLLDNLSALALPLTSVLLMSILVPGASLRRLQTGGLGGLVGLGSLGSPGGMAEKRIALITLLILVAFFLLSLFYYTPITASTDPVIIIEESNSEWEPTWPDYIQTYKMDPVSGTNNYFGMLGILASLYDVTLTVDRPEKQPAVSSVKAVQIGDLSLETLEEIANGRKAVLVVKCLTSPYNQSEIDAILNFTAKGNGLILIGEHTDIYGMCTYLNPISEQMGYRFLPTGVQDVYTDTRGSITQKGELPPLMARYMTGDQVWETSASMEKLANARPLFEVITRPSYFAHYRNETSAFFLTREFTEEIKLNSQFARHLVLAGTTYGDGKVVLFTDSTDFNNGIIGFGDHAPIFIAMVEYVSSEEKYSKAIIPFLLLIMALAVVVLNRRNAFSALVVLSILLLLSFNLSYPLSHYTTQFPELKRDSTIIILKADQHYMEEYLSGMYDMEKLMDKYFQKNLTALIIANPPQEWIDISRGVEDLKDAITDIKPA